MLQPVNMTFSLKCDCRLPSQNANGVIIPAPQDQISRPTHVTAREFMSHFIRITAGFDIAEGWPRFAGKWVIYGVDVRHYRESRRDRTYLKTQSQADMLS
jgi:hypothetical protein